MLNNNVFYREKIPKYTKYEEKPKEARQIVSYKTKKIYDYYI